MSFAICFPKKGFSKKEDLLRYVSFVKQQLKLSNVSVVDEEEGPNETILIVKGSKISMESKAEEEGYLKENSKTGQLDVFMVSNGKMFLNYDKECFWSENEQVSLLYSILDGIIVDFREVKTLLRTMDQSDCRLLHVSMREGKISDVIPLHSKAEKAKLWNKTILKTPLSEEFVDPIYDYFGAEVALYFSWMNHYINWLSAPGILGLFIYLHNKNDDSVSIDNSLLAPFYTIFMVCWSVLFIQFWKRKCAYKTCMWGVTRDSFCPKNYRPEFSGTVRKDPITGKQVLFYPLRYRYVKYVKSVVVTIVMLIVAFSFMVISLNFQGYIHENSNGAAFLHFPSISHFSSPGGIFDPRGGGPHPKLLPFVPCIVHTIVIATLNGKYRSIAIQLTRDENHETQEHFDHSLIIKRFLFEAFDSYIALFFLAFVQADHLLLRAELSALYTVDSIRRIATESLLPFLLQKRSKKHSRKKGRVLSPVELEIQEPEYQQFDDYLEMMIQFGYVTLFASAFPLAGLLSFLSNLVEVKNDLFKLTYVVRRPRSSRIDNIEPWLTMIQALVWLSIMTNVYIFAFTTQQMMTLFPSMFTIEDRDASFGGSDHSHVLVEGQGRWVVVYAVAFEHALILLAKLFYTIVPDTPDIVLTENKRREYRHAELSNKFHKE